MTAWEIYAYWNVDELYGIFNAIAMLTQNADYLGLIKAMIMIGVFAVSFSVFSNNIDILSAWKWFLAALFLYTIMVVPKGTVAIIDRTGTVPAKLVSNVPLSLAVFGHVTSKIGDWLTTSYETTMKTVDPDYSKPGVGFVGNGLLFGHKIINEAENLQPSNIAIRTNLNRYFETCVSPEIDRGTISPAVLVNTNNIWSKIGDVNPSLYVTLVNDNAVDEPSPRTCTDAYNYLTTKLDQAGDESLQNSANKLYPDKDSVSAKNALEASVQGVYGYMFRASDTAKDVFKQRLVANIYANDQKLSSQDVYAITQAETLARQNYSVLSQIAQTTIPKLRNVIEVVIYAVFPIVLIFMIIGGSKAAPAFKSYLMALMWIQIWAPLYAIMNFLVSSYRQTEFQAQIDPTNSLAIAKASLINAGAQSDLNIAGMLAMSIPMISYALVKGGEMAMTSFVSGAMAPATQASSMAAREAGMGNMQLGNVSAGSKSIENSQMFNYSTAPTVNDGPGSVTQENGVKYSHLANGQIVADTTGSENTGSKFELNQRLVESAQYKSAYENSLQAANSHGAQATLATANGFSSSNALTQVANNKQAWGEGYEDQYGHQTRDGFSTLSEVSTTLENADQYTQSQKANLLMGVLMGMGDDGLDANVKAQLQKNYSDDAINSAIEKVSGIDKDTRQHMQEFTQQFAKSEKMQDDFGLDDSQKQSLESSEKQSSELKEQQQAELKKSKSFKKSWEKAEDNAKELSTKISSWGGINNMSPSARRFLENDGAILMSKAMQAKQDGHTTKSEYYMSMFNQRLDELASQFPSSTLPNQEHVDQTQHNVDTAQQMVNEQHQNDMMKSHKQHLKNDQDVQALESAHVLAKTGQQTTIAETAKEQIQQRQYRAATEARWNKDLEWFENQNAEDNRATSGADLAEKREQIETSGETGRVKNIEVNSDGTMRNVNQQVLNVAKAGVQDAVTTIGAFVGNDSVIGGFVNDKLQGASDWVSKQVSYESISPISPVLRASDATAQTIDKGWNERVRSDEYRHFSNTDDIYMKGGEGSGNPNLNSQINERDKLAAKYMAESQNLSPQDARKMANMETFGEKTPDFEKKIAAKEEEVFKQRDDLVMQKLQNQDGLSLYEAQREANKEVFGSPESPKTYFESKNQKISSLASQKKEEYADNFEASLQQMRQNIMSSDPNLTPEQASQRVNQMLNSGAPRQNG